MTTPPDANQPRSPAGSKAADSSPQAKLPADLPNQPSAHAKVLLTASRFRVVERLRADRTGQLQARQIIEHGGSVVVLPITSDGRVCLIRNFRLAVDDWLWELPAGTLELGEDPLECAQRELQEETGMTANVWQPLARFWMSPGILKEQMHLFAAVGAVPGPSNLEPGEEIEPQLVPWAEAMEMLSTGTICDAKTIIGLLAWDKRLAIQALSHG